MVSIPGNQATVKHHPIHQWEHGELNGQVRDAQKVSEGCNGSLISRGVHEHGMHITYPVHVTGFDPLSENDKKEAETEGEDTIFAILYLKNSNRSRFYDLKKYVDND